MKIILFPFSVLYGIAIFTRNKLYDYGLLPHREFSIPVICVGNISVGGTGKTPHIEYLIELLLNNGYRPAVLSRGYGRRTKGFILSSTDSSAEEIGDEPAQIKSKHVNVTVAVCENRAVGIDRLRESVPGINVILLDDAFQHRRVKAGLSLLLTDFNAPYFNDYLLPVGRLREFRSGRKRADAIIFTKSPIDLPEEQKKHMIGKAAPALGQEVYFSSISYGNPYKLNDQANNIPLGKTMESVYMLTALANPVHISTYLHRYSKHLQEFIFPDHHFYTEKDVQPLLKAYNSDNSKEKLIITTEKDAVKLKNLKSLESLPVYVLPVKMEFDRPERINDWILKYVEASNR